jgi:hypothetical protein
MLYDFAADSFDPRGSQLSRQFLDKLGADLRNHYATEQDGCDASARFELQLAALERALNVRARCVGAVREALGVQDAESNGREGHAPTIGACAPLWQPGGRK